MKNVISKFWAIGFIILLWVVFSSPFLLSGKIPFAGDYQVTFFPPWSQYSQFAQPVKNSAMPDVIDQLYPWKHLVITDLKLGEIPLWNPYNFGGTPLMANYQSAVFTPLNFLFFILPFKISWGFLVLLQPLLAGVGMYLFARKITISQVGATLSSVAFMFCGFLVCWMGYATLGYATGVLPFVLLGLEGYHQSKKFLFLCLTSLSLAFSFLSGHFQMSLYVFLAATIYFLFRFVKGARKTFLFGFLALLSGILIACVQIFPSIAFYMQSLRSTIVAPIEIIPWHYLFTLISPDFFGNPITRNDWFGHYAEWNGFLGTIPFVFGLYSLLSIRKNTFVVFFAGLGILSVLLATPTVLSSLIFYLHTPVLSTSAAGRIIVLFSFSFAILAGFGIDSWTNDEKNKKVFLGVMGLFFLFLGWSIILLHFGLSVEHTLIAKQNFLLPSLFLSALLICSLIPFFVKNKRVFFVLALVFLFLSSFDMLRFASKWQTFTSSNLIFPDVGVVQFFQKIKDIRSLGNYGGQVSLYYQIPSIEGYDALYPSRFGEFTSFIADGTVHPASRSVVDFPRNGRYTKQALNLLGVDYVIQKVSDTGKPWAFPIEKYPKDFKIVYKDSAYIVFQNLVAFPRAFLAGHFLIQPNGEKELHTLFSPPLNQQTTLLLEKDPGIRQVDLHNALAAVTSYNANSVTIAVSSKQKSLLFLSDTYFPGWHAYVDGKQSSILRADYTFRAVVVPAGRHTVEFFYQPAEFYIGLLFSACGVISLIGFFILQKIKQI